MVQLRPQLSLLSDRKETRCAVTPKSQVKAHLSHVTETPETPLETSDVKQGATSPLKRYPQPVRIKPHQNTV